MKKVLIIGDSHAACLKQAEKTVCKDFNVVLHFLVASGHSRDCLIFDQSSVSIAVRPIWPKPKNKNFTIEQFDRQYDMLLEMFETIGDSRVVNYRDYIAIVLVGADFLQNYWSEYDSNILNYSHAFLNELFFHKNMGLHGQWLEALKNIDGVDIYSSSVPLTNQLHYDATNYNKPKKSLVDIFDSINHVISCYGATYIPLPETLLSIDKRATKAEFKTQAAHDMRHLNVEGGEIRLRDLLEKIDGINKN